MRYVGNQRCHASLARPAPLPLTCASITPAPSGARAVAQRVGVPKRESHAPGVAWPCTGAGRKLHHVAVAAGRALDDLAGDAVVAQVTRSLVCAKRGLRVQG